MDRYSLAVCRSTSLSLRHLVPPGPSLQHVWHCISAICLGPSQRRQVLLSPKGQAHGEVLPGPVNLPQPETLPAAGILLQHAPCCISTASPFIYPWHEPWPLAGHGLPGREHLQYAQEVQVLHPLTL